jgi:hypothetical protein
LILSLLGYFRLNPSILNAIELPQIVKSKISIDMSYNVLHQCPARNKQFSPSLRFLNEPLLEELKKADEFL